MLPMQHVLCKPNMTPKFTEDALTDDIVSRSAGFRKVVVINEREGRL
jgi:hypothetical protein